MKKYIPKEGISSSALLTMLNNAKTLLVSAGMSEETLNGVISTIEQMDKVLFIDGGRLAGFGTHDKLYETNAEYRKMVDLQRLEEEGGEQNA